ncbi:hypothetical protein N7G274_002678 [Stereocaulon virgatum]|uniref:Cytochrome P450 n=1 Tax=Stereocaulon virgatum TaxID=373712 RepID=A0ABR4AN81_9LECA
MDFPWSSAVLRSIAGSFILVRLTPIYTFGASYIGTFFVLLLLQIFAVVLWQAVLWPRLFSPLRHLPTPKGGSFFNGHFTTITKEPSGHPHRRWFAEVPNKGLIYYKTLLNQERLLPTSPEALRETLMTKCYEFEKPAMTRLGLQKVLGVGVLLAEGEEHKRQRHALNPAFDYRHIIDLHPTFWDISHRLVDALMTITTNRENTSEKSLSNAPVVEIGGWASRATLDIIGDAGMGQDFNAIEDPNTPLNATYRKVFQIPSSQQQLLGLLSFFLPTWFVRSLPLTHNANVAEASTSIKKVCHELIHRKQEKLNLLKREEEGQDKAGGKTVRDKDILSVALSSGEFTEDDLVNQMMTFLAAGHETTASSLVWAFYLLCKHREMQTRLREEVRANLPSISDASTKLTATALDHCYFLKAFCNEVLRIYPVVPITLREAAHDTTILDQFVPKGTKIIFSPMAINTSTSMWGPDADKFDPDRWMAPGQSKTGGANSAYAYMTFLQGYRACIGMKFAMTEFACLVAAVVGRFEFEFEDPEYPSKIKIKGGITSKPKDGLHMRMRPLEGW